MEGLVVHNCEVHAETGVLKSFYWGHNYPKKDGHDAALRRAVETFVLKAVKWYNLPVTVTPIEEEDE